MRFKCPRCEQLVKEYHQHKRLYYWTCYQEEIHQRSRLEWLKQERMEVVDGLRLKQRTGVITIDEFTVMLEHWDRENEI